MNLIEGSLVDNHGNLGLMTKQGILPIEKEKAHVLQKAGYFGKDIVIGIRPEEVRLIDDTKESVTVVVSEILGSESYLYFEEYGQTLCIHTNNRTDIKRGDQIAYTFNWDNVHVFDAVSTKRIKL